MNRERPSAWITAVATLGLLLLYLPLGAVLLYSFNDAEKGTVWRGFTLRWYAELAADPDASRRAWEIREAAYNTLLLASISTVAATVMGTLLGLGMARSPWPQSLSRMLDAIVDLPVITPDILFAATLVVAFNVLRSVSSVFEPGIVPMIIGHVTFQIAFVALIVRSRLIVIGPAMSEAARDLYASSWYHFRRVTLPLLWPAIVGGAMLAFTLSLDDFVISFFSCGPSSTTLPIYVYHSQMRGIRTDLFAVSTLLILGTVIPILAVERLTRWRKD